VPTVDNLALLTEAVDVWTRVHGYALVDVPWFPDGASAWCGRPLAARALARRSRPPPTAADGMLALWDGGALPIAPGYVAWRPVVRNEADVDGLRSPGAVTLDLYVPVASTEEGRAVLVTLIARDKLVLSSLATKLGEPGLRMAVHETGDHARRLLLNKRIVASFGFRPTRRGGYVYGTALALPGFAAAVAARERTVSAPVATSQRPGLAPGWWTRLTERPAVLRGTESEATAQ
jgi:hypothetical protein